MTNLCRWFQGLGVVTVRAIALAFCGNSAIAQIPQDGTLTKYGLSQEEVLTIEYSIDIDKVQLSDAFPDEQVNQFVPADLGKFQLWGCGIDPITKMKISKIQFIDIDAVDEKQAKGFLSAITRSHIVLSGCCVDQYGDCVPCK